MKISEFADKLKMNILTGEIGVENEVCEIYSCDLLSLVMSSASKDCAWITVHTHLNVVAVALMAQIQCIIIPENIAVEEATIKKAIEEGIVILGSELNSFP